MKRSKRIDTQRSRALSGHILKIIIFSRYCLRATTLISEIDRHFTGEHPALFVLFFQSMSCRDHSSQYYFM